LRRCLRLLTAAIASHSRSGVGGVHVCASRHPKPPNEGSIRIDVLAVRLGLPGHASSIPILITRKVREM
jgi:hypothetical protein